MCPFRERSKFPEVTRGFDQMKDLSFNFRVILKKFFFLTELEIGPRTLIFLKDIIQNMLKMI